MEGILFGFFIGSLFGAAAVKVVQGLIANHKAAAWAKHLEHFDFHGEVPSHNLLSHNNLDWMKKGASE